MCQKPFHRSLVHGKRSSMRIGFSLVELVIVIAVILALAAMGMPIWNKVKRDGEVSATRILVQTVALAITSYERRDWAYLVYDGSATDPAQKFRPKVCNLWDLNNDNILDGDPDILDKDNVKYPPPSFPFPADRVKELNADGTRGGYVYRGFYDMVNPTLGKQFFDKETRRICDPWRTGTKRHPLHIYFAANTYGSSWFGVYSTGPDGIDQYGVPQSDDICSWR